MNRGLQLGLCCTLLTGTALLGLKQPDPCEPRIQGKLLSGWLRQLEYRPDALPEVKRALNHERHQVLPCLVTWITTKAEPSAQGAADTCEPHPGSALSPQAARAEERRRLAVVGFLALKETARPAIPDLTRALNDGELAPSVANVLGAMESEGLCALTNALANPDKRVRMAVLQTLVFKAREPAVRSFTPLLLPLLEDPEADVRANAAEALGLAGDQPGVIIPKLIALLDDPAPSARCAAADALGRHGPQARAALPKLAACHKAARLDRERNETARAIDRIEGRELRRRPLLLASAPIPSAHP
jgi:hypothetical protein